MNRIDFPVVVLTQQHGIRQRAGFAVLCLSALLSEACGAAAVSGGARVTSAKSKLPTALRCATMHVTDLALPPGERLVEPPFIGDSVRWILYRTRPSDQTQHVVIKPTRSGLSTNVVLLTDRSAYDIKLRSYDGAGDQLPAVLPLHAEAQAQ